MGRKSLQIKYILKNQFLTSPVESGYLHSNTVYYCHYLIKEEQKKISEQNKYLVLCNNMNGC